ncbi:MAG: hypothetical protein RIR73_285 [Chloroflexota bacterium]|jgi:hypothetical protein
MEKAFYVHLHELVQVAVMAAKCEMMITLKSI